MRERISLDGTWQFTEAGAENWRTGTVPGCVQLDLMALGELPDPFYRLEEAQAYPLEEKEWVYRREFTFNGGGCRAELVFEGLDTVATLYLNGHYLGKVENMFIPHRFDVGEFLQIGTNTVEVRFASATRVGAALRQAYSEPQVGDERIFLRKAQYAYGWDWGPRLAQVGIWRSVYLELSGAARLAHPFFLTRRIEGKTAEVEVTAEVIPAVAAQCGSGEGKETAGGGVSFAEADAGLKDLQVVLTIKEENGRPVAQMELPVTRQGEGWGVQATLRLADAKLWYPNGIGPQPLYQVEMVLRQQGGEQAGEEWDRLSFTTGIRTVKLLRERDAAGESFIFVINGVKVFAKGADWIPADNFLPRLKEADYDAYIRLAKESNMNMLRVWGGGIYEDPAFYTACDRYGIMVWQDFMYACAQYPDHTAWFREAAEAEAVTVIKALRNHPSLVLWCGNNENNWGFHSWWRVGDPEYMGNYLYKQLLPRLCAWLDPSRPYWVSSPYGGQDPNSENEGDRHAWDVWSGWQDYGNYRLDRGRFLSEFGFQAMPTWPTVLSYTAPEDRKITSPVVISHNKMREGTERLLRFLAGRVGLPRDFRSFVYLTQFNQAEAIKTGVEHWRKRKFATAGTLYWQFNDCWPVASWSCLDYYRRKKALYYYSRHFYADLLIVLEPALAQGLREGELKNRIRGVQVTLVNDDLRARSGELRLACYNLAGEKRGEIRKQVEIPANGVLSLGSFAAEAFGLGYTPLAVPVPQGNSLAVGKENGELLESVIFAELVSEGKVYRNYLVFQPFRDLPLRDPQVSVTVREGVIAARSVAPAFGVFLEPEQAVDLADNCLWLEPGVEREIACSGNPGRVEVFDLTGLRQDI